MVKSDRELHSHTRKDYAKMVNVNSDLEEEHVQEPGIKIKKTTTIMAARSSIQNVFSARKKVRNWTMVWSPAMKKSGWRGKSWSY